MDAAAGDDSEWQHGVHIYGDDADLIVSMERHLLDGWSVGGAAIVIATPRHRSGMRERLSSRGCEQWLGDGRLVELDARATLQLFMRDGVPDRELFDRSVGDLVRETAAERPLHAFGEMVDVLWAEGNTAAALQLEGLWGELQHQVDFALLCSYSEETVGHEGHGAIIRAHDHVAR